ncbi:orotidine-5'-phosphate decarboxylase [Apilactobacillus sp. TMW 2.2459]|uniref:orotidine-5'-phosphate decarboxylase n=1 Tax=Apilactobacillus xinyiensis TaxID=2841032 RepID=UPI00201042AA|nr:orotidine-5'-phosphate decarboxylase [Apilactobacillus xinyiensis]MCL0312506.1 orotidine-5'-phosphate decarboxylase [Apilactobacillus xinyiensis]
MKPIFIALDFHNLTELKTFMDNLKHQENLYVKVGMEIFYSEGKAVIEYLKKQNIKIFLDLKLYDIPSTVEKAAYELGKLNISYITVHASGGSKMIKAAKNGVMQAAKDYNYPEPAKILAVTELTSFSEQQMQKEQLVNQKMPEMVTHLAKLAYQNNADGVICSALENQMIHTNTSKEFLCINPGIRLASDNKDDQQRVVTPQKAKQLGSNGIVVGRSITKSNQPNESYRTILKEWS